MEWRPFGDDGSALLFSGATNVGVVSKREGEARWLWRLTDVAPSRYGPATGGERATPNAARAALTAAWRRWLAERGLCEAGAAEAKHAALVEALRSLAAESVSSATGEVEESIAADGEGHGRRAAYLDGKGVGRRSVSGRLRELLGDVASPRYRRNAVGRRRASEV